MIDLNQWDNAYQGENKPNSIIKDDRVGWQSRLTRNNDDMVKYNFANLKLIFDNDKNLKTIFAFDCFRNIEILKDKPVWHRPTTSGKAQNSPFTDHDEIQVRNYIRETYNVTGDNTKLFSDMIQKKCLENSYNPVTTYLDTCYKEWDNKERLKEVGQDFLGLNDTEYNEQALKIMMVGAVARAYEPSCKFDYMGVIVGNQGVGKSTFLSRLGGEWFTDSLNGMNSKDDMQITLGAWIIEDSELSALKNSRIDQVKRFITRTIDTLRLPYGKRTVSYARRFVLWGTTNQSTFLFDKTGTRRFLIFKSNKSNVKRNVYEEFSQELVNQIWGEVVHLYKNGFKLKLSDELEEEAQRVREEYQNVDELHELIQEYLEIPLPKEWYQLEVHDKRFYINDMLQNGFSPKYQGIDIRDRITIKEILSELLKLDYKDSATPQYKRQSKDIRDTMKSFDDWELKQQVKINGRNTSGFIKK